jgi:hypothetical protein
LLRASIIDDDTTLAVPQFGIAVLRMIIISSHLLLRFVNISVLQLSGLL